LAESRQESTFVNNRCKDTNNKVKMSTFAKKFCENGLHLSIATPHSVPLGQRIKASFIAFGLHRPCHLN
jgi:hypothetical protein